MAEPIRCRLFGHRLYPVPSSSLRVVREGKTMGYDVTAVCTRKQCDYADPVPYFYGVDTPDALYLEH